MMENHLPYQLWYDKIPDVSNLRVFGCVASVLIPKTKRSKFEARSESAIFIGYAHDSNYLSFIVSIILTPTSFAQQRRQLP